MYAIHPIQKQDDAALAAIVRQTLKFYGLAIPGTAYFDKELDHLSDFYQQTPQRQYFVVTDETGQVLGGTGIGEYDSENGIAELQKLYLLPVARGHHLSYKLLDTAVAFARKAGYQKLYLETHHNLKTAVHLYQKYGFHKLAHSLNGGEHDSMDLFYLMTL